MDPLSRITSLEFSVAAPLPCQSIYGVSFSNRMNGNSSSFDNPSGRIQTYRRTRMSTNSMTTIGIFYPHQHGSIAPQQTPHAPHLRRTLYQNFCPGHVHQTLLMLGISDPRYMRHLHLRSSFFQAQIPHQPNSNTGGLLWQQHALRMLFKASGLCNCTPLPPNTRQPSAMYFTR